MTKDITLICVVWNESLMLPHFINYYKSIGVTRFIFIDNNSNDGTKQYLKQRTDVNTTLYKRNTSYAEANFGIDWVNEILINELRDQWCLVVDIDELLILKNSMTLSDLAQQMEETDSNILQTVLIDFYPKTFESEKLNHYSKGENFLSHSNYFHRFTENSIFHKFAPDGSREIKGGMRHMILNGSKKPNSTSVCLTKRSFFKYDFYNTHKLVVGMHWILPHEFTCWWPPEKAYSNWQQSNRFLKFFKDQIILAHFKYIKPNIKQVFQERVDRNQDWNNSSEYKKYMMCLKTSYFDQNMSVLYTTPEFVYQNTIDTL